MGIIVAVGPLDGRKLLGLGDGKALGELLLILEGMKEGFRVGRREGNGE